MRMPDQDKSEMVAKDADLFDVCRSCSPSLVSHVEKNGGLQAGLRVIMFDLC